MGNHHTLPKLRKHRFKTKADQAYVNYPAPNGGSKRTYFGPWGFPETQSRYQRWLIRYLSGDLSPSKGILEIYLKYLSSNTIIKTINAPKPQKDKNGPKNNAPASKKLHSQTSIAPLKPAIIPIINTMNTTAVVPWK